VYIVEEAIIKITYEHIKLILGTFFLQCAVHCATFFLYPAIYQALRDLIVQLWKGTIYDSA